MVQNYKKVCPLHSISREPYIIWLSFIMIISWCIVESPAISRRVLSNRVCLSFCPSVCPSVQVFAWNYIISFFRITCEFVDDRARFYRKIFFPLKIGKMGPKWPQNRFFSIYWKIWSLIFYWIWSIMKLYINFCVPAQIPYLGIFCSWDMGQNVLS